MPFKDYWEDNGNIYVIDWARFGVNEKCQTVFVGYVEGHGPPETPQEAVKPAEDKPLQSKEIDSSIPDNLSQIKCLVCGKTVPGKRPERKYCSDKCRQIAHRKNRQLVML